MERHYKAIESKLYDECSPSFLEVVNESHQHSVPENSETHFKITVVSDVFKGLSAVKRHQLVYVLLQEELDAGVHALALHLYTPEQWSERHMNSPVSPPCAGGSKAS